MNPLAFLHGLLTNTENFVGGVVHGAGQAVNSVFHPQPQQPQPQVQRPAPSPAPKINLASLAHAIGQVHLQGVEQLTGHPVTLGSIGKGIADAANQGVVQPVLRGGQELNSLANTGHLNNPRQFLSDAATTGLNFATLGKGKEALAGAEALTPKIIQGLKEGAILGGASGGAQTLANKNATAADYAKNIALGASVGGAVGGAAPIVGRGIRIAAKEGPDAVRGEAGGVRLFGLGPKDAVTNVDGKLTAPPTDGATAIGPTGKATRYASKTIPASDFVSQPIKDVTKKNAPMYTPETEKAGLQTANDLVNKLGPDASIEHVQKALDAPLGQISRQDVLNAQTVAAGLDARGGDVAHNTAAQLYDALSAHLTKAGQTVQAAAMMARRSPEGLQYQAFRDLRRAGVPVTDELATKINQHIETIRAAGDDAAAKARGLHDLSTEVIKNVPQSKLGNAVSVWKAGLLSGVKTQGGNFLSNGTFGLAKKIADVPATLADKAFSVATGERTKALNLFGGAGSGFKKGLGTGFETIKTGYDPRNITKGGKYEQYAELYSKNPAVQNLLYKPANFVFRSMNAADQPFYYAALGDSLRELGKVQGINQGLKGAELKAFAKDFAANPTPEAAQIAINDAEKAVLGHTTVIGSVPNFIKRGIDQMDMPDSLKAISKSTVDLLAPFAKVPGAFLSRVVDFTPAGVLKEAGMQIAKKQFDQRAMSEAIGAATTGTAALWLGYQLAKNNLLSGDYPKNDPKEAARWKAEGITPNSVKVGGTWYSLNYLGPIGLLFGAAKNMQDANTKGQGNPGGAALAGLGSGLLGQSFLQGLSGFSDAIKDPARNAKSFVNSEAGSIVPSISSDVANVTDIWQRQANTAWESIMARIPGVRGDLQKKTDTFGNDLNQAGGTVGGFNPNQLNPLKPSIGNDTPLLSEIDRLSAVKQAVIPVTATTIGKDVKLTPEQQTQRQKTVGSMLTPVWNDIIASPAYQKLDDIHKKAALQGALDDVDSAANRKLLATLAPEQNTKPATGNVALILMGKTPDPGQYVTKAIASQNKTDGGVTSAKISPADQYKIDLATYKSNKAAGILSSPQDFKAQTSLAKEAITSKYSQDVLDFYSMGKKEATAYFKADPTTAAKLYDQAKQLDAELSGTKYKYGLGTKAKKVKLPKFSKPKSFRAGSLKLKSPRPKGLKIAGLKTPASKKTSLTA